MSARAPAGRAHVGVNLLWLVPSVVGGSEEYTTRLLAAVAERPHDDLDITLFVLRPFVDAYPELVDAFPTDVCSLSGRSKALRIVAESTWLLAAARRRRVHLLHHAGGTIPMLRATPTILSIHDLQPLLMPSNFTGTKQRYLSRRLPASAARTRMVISPSEFSRRTVVDMLHVPEERTAVVPPGYTPALREEPECDPRTAFGIDRPFFLYPAITYPHKNHLVLVRAFAQVVDQGVDALLVLTHRSDVMEDELQKLVIEEGLADRVRRIGHVPRGDLDWLYGNAIALTFVSRFEGFGLPVLEAMGNRCPVIAANATALPDVVGDAGILVDPDDVQGWATAMLELARDDERRAQLIEAGAARVGTFQWATSASALTNAYRSAAMMTDR